MKGVIEEPQARELAIPASIDFYHQAYELGLIDRHCELLEGLIVKKIPKSPLHQALADYFAELLRLTQTSESLIRTEGPITLSAVDSEPEPDISVVFGNRADFLEAHPTTAELVAEISISTIPLDRQKARLYASAGIKEFWLILPTTQTIEVFSDPDCEAQSYRNHQVYEGPSKVTCESLPDFALTIPGFFALKQ